MKKLPLLLGMIIILSPALSSCKRKFQCTCTITRGNGAVDRYYIEVKTTKKKAQEACNDKFIDDTCTLDD